MINNDNLPAQQQTFETADELQTFILQFDADIADDRSDYIGLTYPATFEIISSESGNLSVKISK